MISFAEKIAALEMQGYANAPAMAKLAHDVVLKALEKCGFSDHITIKGGVVMSSITEDLRRATMDMDVDFIRYGLSDDEIDGWIERLNCIDGVRITRSGDIEELRQRNYRGKRVYLNIKDSAGVAITTKLDIGVHVHEEIRQRPRRFAISLDEPTAILPANSGEQIFVEKLKSLLRLGARSARPKDVFDMYYLIGRLDDETVRRFISLLIFDDSEMRESSFTAICNRLRIVFSSQAYVKRLDDNRANWLNVSPQMVISALMGFLAKLGK
jgi:predicted nucleotidyltransferase component of viral defense system